MDGSRRCEFQTTKPFIMIERNEILQKPIFWAPKMQNERTKLSSHFFMADRELRSCRVAVFNLFVCFEPVLIKGFSYLIPLPSQQPLCKFPCPPLSFYLFNLWKEPKGVPTVPSSRRAAFPTGLKMPAERTQAGSGKARQVLSITQSVKREEGARKRERAKAGSRVGAESLSWIGGISSPRLLKGGFLDICPDTCRVKEVG